MRSADSRERAMTAPVTLGLPGAFSARPSPVPTVLTMDDCEEDFDEDLAACIAAYEECSLQCQSPCGSGLQMRPPTSSMTRQVRQSFDRSERLSFSMSMDGQSSFDRSAPGHRAHAPQTAPEYLNHYRPTSAGLHLSPTDALRGRGPVLTVMVGSFEFKSTGSTLRKAPYFENMLTKPDGSGQFPNPIFIDRSGDLFKYILDYLRSGHWLLGPRAADEEFLSALRQEANFYGLGSLSDVRPWPRVSEYITVWQFRDDTSLYVDCQEETIREDPAHQGLFRLCKYSGGLPLDLQTNIRRFKAASNYMQAALAYFGMRGFALQHILEGSMIMHVTSADGQSRTAPGTQYILHRQISVPPTSWGPLETARNVVTR